MQIYAPQVLTLKQMCAVVVKKHMDILTPDFWSLPVTLQDYVHKTRKYWVPVMRVQKLRSKALLDKKDLSILKKFEGKFVYHCFACDYCGCCRKFTDFNGYLMTPQIFQYWFTDLSYDYSSIPMCFYCDRDARNFCLFPQALDEKLVKLSMHPDSILNQREYLGDEAVITGAQRIFSENRCVLLEVKHDGVERLLFLPQMYCDQLEDYDLDMLVRKGYKMISRVLSSDNGFLQIFSIRRF